MPSGAGRHRPQEALSNLLALCLAVVLVLVPVFWAMLRTRPDTLNRQIDALARKTRARDAT